MLKLLITDCSKNHDHLKNIYRIFKLCNSKEIGDEFHYFMKCTDSVMQTSRLQNLSKYYQSNPNVIRFENLRKKSSLKFVNI